LLKPLLKIFAPDSATPVLAAARLQRWSLRLSSYQYEIRYKSSEGHVEKACVVAEGEHRH
jgi:hypothetical protein